MQGSNNVITKGGCAPLDPRAEGGGIEFAYAAATQTGVCGCV